MIAALLLRFGVPKWLAWLILAAGVAASALWYRADLIEQGVAKDKARSDAVIAAADHAAEVAVAGKNGQIRVLQAKLDATAVDNERIKGELDHEKTISTQRQLNLLAGRDRLRILTHPAASPAVGNEPPGCVTPAGMGSTAGVVADIDGTAAAWIDGVRTERNAVILRLAACVAAYDSVRESVNALP